MSLLSVTKHVLHCILMFFVIAICMLNRRCATKIANYEEAIEAYGIIPTILLYLPRITYVIPFPAVLIMFIGLVIFNAFPDEVEFKGILETAPFICIRVVTRGDFPELLKRNVSINLKVCREVCLKNFVIQVVTEKPLNLTKQPNVLETLVPLSYRTNSGAMFKARNLQYCLEEGPNFLTDQDYIVHLDEETLLTPSGIRGVVNFAIDGEHHFGTGLVTYGKYQIVNMFCTIADGLKTVDDMGRSRFEMCIFHRSLTFVKGCFLVAKFEAERKVSFDHSLEGSISEDLYISRIADSYGYTYDFITGEMWETSSFTLYDFVKQRKRWMQGLMLVLLSSKIPLKYKLITWIYALPWFLTPLSLIHIIIRQFLPLPTWPFMETIISFNFGLYIYFFIFGVLKGVSLENVGAFKFILCIIGACFAAPLNILLESIALVWGAFSDPKKFDVVCKENNNNIFKSIP